MGELISVDVLDWARDLVAMNKLLAVEQIKRSRPLGPAKVFNFRARITDCKMVLRVEHGGDCGSAGG